MGAITATISTSTQVDATQNEFIVYGTLTFSGTYTAGGDTLNLGAFPQVPSNSVPLWVNVHESVPAGDTPTGYQFVFCPGTTSENGVLAIFSTEGTQFSGLYGTTFANGVSFQAFYSSFN